VAAWDATPPAETGETAEPALEERPRRVASRRVHSIPVTPEPAPPAPEPKPEKKSVFGRIADLFR
jgi:hypothetical protein